MLEISHSELELLTDPELFQRKNKLTNAIIQLLGELNYRLERNSTLQHAIEKFQLPSIKGKVSRGENYLGYPWQILDYPRVFEKENVFAFRNLFWWGNFFSSTLHLSGKYFDQASSLIFKNLPLISNDKMLICVNDNQWHHHLNENNYRKLSEIINSKEEVEWIQEKKFIKLCIPHPLSEFENTFNHAESSLEEFLKIIA